MSSHQLSAMKALLPSVSCALNVPTISIEFWLQQGSRMTEPSGLEPVSEHVHSSPPHFITADDHITRKFFFWLCLSV